MVPEPHAYTSPTTKWRGAVVVGVICYGAEGATSPPYLSFRPDPILPPSQPKFSFSENIVTTKINLHNSSIHWNKSVFFSTFLPLLLLYGSFFSFLCYCHLIWENWLQLYTPPPQTGFWENYFILLGTDWVMNWMWFKMGHAFKKERLTLTKRVTLSEIGRMEGAKLWLKKKGIERKTLIWSRTLHY